MNFRGCDQPRTGIRGDPYNAYDLCLARERRKRPRAAAEDGEPVARDDFRASHSTSGELIRNWDRDDLVGARRARRENTSACLTPRGDWQAPKNEN
jgi:hypothetical protein